MKKLLYKNLGMMLVFMMAAPVVQAAVRPASAYSMNCAVCGQPILDGRFWMHQMCGCRAHQPCVSAELSTTGRCPGCLTALVYSSGVVVSLAPEAPVVLASIWHGREYKLFEPGVVDPVAWLDGVVACTVKSEEEMLLRFLAENEQGEFLPGTR